MATQHGVKWGVLYKQKLGAFNVYIKTFPTYLENKTANHTCHEIPCKANRPRFWGNPQYYSSQQNKSFILHVENACINNNDCLRSLHECLVSFRNILLQCVSSLPVLEYSIAEVKTHPVLNYCTTMQVKI